jgi:FkbM family methyltransferase
MRTYPPGLTVETHLRTLLPLVGVDCVLDVGAHRGEFGTLVRGSGYAGRIVSFEPSSENAEYLAHRAAGDRDWLVRREALGRENGQLALNLTARTPFSSFREPLAEAMESFPGAAVQAQEEVTVRRLDDVIEDCLPRPDSRVFLKLDTQGWDLEVLAGATRSMAAVVCLQSEISVRPIYRGMPRYLEALQVMEAMGFELTGLFPVARDAELRIVELDCVMVRSGAVNRHAQIAEPSSPRSPRETVKEGVLPDHVGDQ